MVGWSVVGVRRGPPSRLEKREGRGEGGEERRERAAASARSADALARPRARKERRRHAPSMTSETPLPSLPFMVAGGAGQKERRVERVFGGGVGADARARLFVECVSRETGLSEAFCVASVSPEVCVGKKERDDEGGFSGAKEAGGPPGGGHDFDKNDNRLGTKFRATHTTQNTPHTQTQTHTHVHLPKVPPSPSVLPSPPRAHQRRRKRAP
jgi:hypothetical protein